MLLPGAVADAVVGAVAATTAAAHFVRRRTVSFATAAAAAAADATHVGHFTRYLQLVGCARELLPLDVSAAVAAVAAVACCRCAPSHESRRTRLAANNIEIEAICLLLSRILRVIKKGARTATATAAALEAAAAATATQQDARRIDMAMANGCGKNWSLQWQFVAITCGAIYI